jgi:1,4-dihydroxy-2-naphthoyl-CoA hydrolase
VTCAVEGVSDLLLRNEAGDADNGTRGDGPADRFGPGHRRMRGVRGWLLAAGGLPGGGEQLACHERTEQRRDRSQELVAGRARILVVTCHAVSFTLHCVDDAVDYDSLVRMMPFAAALGVHIDEADATQAVARLPFRDDLCTTGGLLHGGVLMSFADTLGAVVAFLGLPEGAGTATIASSTQLMRGASGDVTGRTAVLHRGRSTVTVQTTVFDADDRVVAQTTQVQAVLAARS